MIGLEVSVNGKRLFTAGIGPDGIFPTTCLAATVTCGGYAEEKTIDVGAQRVASDGTMDIEGWPRQHLSLGDEVSIRIVDIIDGDPPTIRRPLEIGLPET